MGLIREEEKFVIANDYEITFRPVPDESYDKLPEQARKRLDDAYIMAKGLPDDAIPELEKLKAEFPNVAKIYNFLFNAYIITGNFKKAEEIAEENFKKNPDYLFARINYAYTFLRKKQYDKIPPIFDNKFDLKAIFPNRKTFHISEFAGFTDFITMYFMETKKFTEAKNTYIIFKKIAPTHRITPVIQRRIRQVN
jgi:tetratricopeptide (TPR) repeat protein